MTVRKLAKRLVTSLGIVAICAFPLAAIGGAEVPATVVVYQGSTRAAGVHEVGGTNNFPNWANGAIDNRYPLAATNQDSSPYSHATASSADYGPAVATVAAGDLPVPCPLPPAACPPHNPPPATYADAQYPNPPGSPDASYSAGASDHSEAHAGELLADARGTYSGGSGATFNNSTAEAHSIVKPDGSLVATTHAHVGSADIGPIHVSNVDVTTTVTSVNGKATAKATVDPGQVTNAGTPVQPGSGPTAPAPVDTPLLTIQVYVTAPVQDVKGNKASIFASGLHVAVRAKSEPTLFTDYILGEGFSEGFMVNQVALPPVTAAVAAVDNLGTVDNSGAAPTTTTVTSGYTGATPTDIRSVPKGSGTPVKTAPRRFKTLLASTALPFPLAPMFFLWEALVLGAAAAIVWARRNRLRQV